MENICGGTIFRVQALASLFCFEDLKQSHDFDIKRYMLCFAMNKFAFIPYEIVHIQGIYSCIRKYAFGFDYNRFVNASKFPGKSVNIFA